MMQQLCLDLSPDLNPDWQRSFAHFWRGQQHSALLHHLESLFEPESESFIYLWGESGVGKTHLLEAICHRAHGLGLQAGYVDFARPGTLAWDLLDQLEHLDALCIDNLDQLNDARYHHFHVDLFRIFNACHERQTVLVVAAKQGAEAFEAMLPDLRSRLNSGLRFHMLPLFHSEKRQALFEHAQRLGLVIAPHIIDYIMTYGSRSTADLSCLLRMLAKATLTHQRKVTLPFVRKLMQPR